MGTGAFAQVGIGTDNPHGSTLLHLESTDKGFLLPILTRAQRNAIVNPVNGLMIYNSSSDSKCVEFYTETSKGNAWTNYCCDQLVSNGTTGSGVRLLFSDSSVFHTGLNGAGSQPVDGGLVESIGPVNLSFVSTSLNAAYFNLVDRVGPNENIYSTEPTVNDYASSGFLTAPAGNNPDYLAIETGLANAAAYSGPFTLTIVARFNVANLPNNSSFFSVGSGSSASAHAFQISNGDTQHYTMPIGGSGNSASVRSNVPVDDKFHTFVIVKDPSQSWVQKWYIDGVEQGALPTVLNQQVELYGEIRLLTNRGRNIRADSSIAYFGIEERAYTDEEIVTFSKVSSCLTD